VLGKAVPVMRTVDRMELPSTSAAKMRPRSSLFNLFILTIMHSRLCIVKGQYGPGLYINLPCISIDKTTQRRHNVSS
jgi:hypothetical protein